MAKLNNGITGGGRGKVGNVVSVLRYGEYHLRSLPAKVHNPKTPKQQGNRNGFGLTSSLCKIIKPFIKQGFKTSRGTYWNTAVSIISQSAIRGENPDRYIDYQYVKVADGLLMTARAASVILDSSGTFRFQWEDNSGEGNAKAGDRAMLLVINADKKQCAYQLKGAQRNMGQDFIDGIPDSFKEGSLYAYIAFTSADESMVSDSVFVPLG